jgi:drug/metabolite transporter (DMT)-like permease
MRRAALAFAAGAVALWSTNAITARYLLASHPLALVQLLQFTGAALVFLAVRPLSAAAPIAPRDLPAFAAIGFVGLVGTMVLQYLAFALMPVVEANLIAYAWPLMVAAAIVVAGRAERPGLLMASAAAGFVGVGLVMTGGRGAALMSGSLAGYAAALGSALCMAFYTLAVGRSTGAAADRLLLPSALAGAAGCLVWSLHDRVDWAIGSDLLLGLYLGAGPMGLGYCFWSCAMQRDESGRTALVAYLTPVASTALLGFAGERLTLGAAIGAALVIASCFALGLERGQDKEVRNNV